MPLASQMRKDQALSDFSVRYANPSYIADRVFPRLRGIVKNEGFIYKYDRSNLREENAGPLGQRTPAPEANWSVLDVPYKLGRYSLKELVTQEEIDEADVTFDPEEDTVEMLTDKLLVIRERKAAQALFSASNWPLNTTLSGTDQWSDAASDPIDDLETGRKAMARKPNLIVFGDAVWSKFRHHAKVVDRFKYTSGGIISGAQVAEILDIPAENVLIGDAQYNAAKEGVADVMADIWGKHCSLLYVDPNPRRKSLTACATLSKEASREVYEWPNEDPEGVWKRVQDHYQHLIVASDLGYFIQNAVA